MRKLFFVSILLLLCFSIYTNLHPTIAFAAKKRIRKTTATKTSKQTATVYSTARLSRPTNSIVVNFQNLTLVKKITYELSYATNSIQQGAVGSILPSGASTDSRDFYFGTCSKGVCTPHTNITNAMLIIDFELKSGATYTKRYRIKI